MIYTYQRRKAMNKVVQDLYPDIVFHEDKDSVPVMTCHELPKEAVRIDDSEDFIQKVEARCSRPNEIGAFISDYGKALPVFILTTELEGREIRHFFRVNYVSMAEASIRWAMERIYEGKLYAVIKDTCNP